MWVSGYMPEFGNGKACLAVKRQYGDKLPHGVYETKMQFLFH